MTSYVYPIYPFYFTFLYFFQKFLHFGKIVLPKAILWSTRVYSEVEEFTNKGYTITGQGAHAILTRSYEGLTKSYLEPGPATHMQKGGRMIALQIKK